MLLSTAAYRRPSLMSILLLLTTLLSLFGSSHATPTFASDGFGSIFKRAVDPTLFTQKNVIQVIRDKIGRQGYIFYFNGNEGSANTMADANTPPGYYSFDQIFSSDVMRAIGITDKTEAGVPEALSLYMAQAARGNVAVFGVDPPNPRSFWTLYEYPALYENLQRGKVTSLRYFYPGEENVNNYYASLELDKRSGKVVRRVNTNYKAPAGCRRDGTCYTNDMAQQLVDAMNAQDGAGSQKPPVPSDVPDYQAGIEDDYQPPDSADPSKSVFDTDPTLVDSSDSRSLSTQEAEQPDQPDSQTPDQPDSQDPTDPNKPTKTQPKPVVARPPKRLV